MSYIFVAALLGKGQEKTTGRLHWIRGNSSYMTHEDMNNCQIQIPSIVAKAAVS